MRILLIALATLIVWQDLAQAASRTWRDRKGQEIKAEFTGVLNGKIVLKTAAQRISVGLSELSLADRDYLVETLIKRKKEQLLQLMTAENKIPVINPDAVPVRNNNNDFEGGLDYSDGSLGGSNPFTPSALNSNAAGQDATVETEMYGLPLPSPELLVEDNVRTWTSLTGLKQLATFDRVLAPGFFRLKKADGSTGEFAMVNFVRADINYVKEALQKDMARPVFPEGSGFQSLTPDDVSRGYRVWTDRKQVPLVGKFVAIKRKNVVIEVAGANQEYPKAGLSAADLSWVNDEIRRLAKAAEARRQASSSSGGGYTGSGGTSRFPFSRRPTFPTRPTFPSTSRFGSQGDSDMEMEMEYADAGNSQETSPFGRAGSRFGTGGQRDLTSIDPVFPSVPKLEFQFACDRCGHKWTRTDTSIDQCPQCSNRNRVTGGSGDSSGSDSSASSSKETSGVLMTIVYVGIGLAVLGGIAGGLFRAFG